MHDFFHLHVITCFRHNYSSVPKVHVNTVCGIFINLFGGDTIKQNSRAGDIVLGLFLYVFVLWAALLIAQCWGGSIVDLLPRMAEALQQPTAICWTERSALSILLCSGAYFFGIALYFTTRGRTRDGEEHGSAVWGSPEN